MKNGDKKEVEPFEYSALRLSSIKYDPNRINFAEHAGRPKGRLENEACAWHVEWSDGGGSSIKYVGVKMLH
jgi:hypothetical protein